MVVIDTFDDDEVSGAPTPAPVRIGRYALIEQVGRGGMGVVFAAWDPQLDRKVAIKLVDDARVGNRDDGRHRLEQEARAAATLNHPNVVTIYDVGVYQGRVFLAMEFVEGGTLRSWLRGVIRPWTEVVAMFLEVGRGLAAAHAVGLVHRDFKPDNVLVEIDARKPDATGRPRIADFGLAYSREVRHRPTSTTCPGESDPRGSGGSATPAVAGTPAYMSPEQFDGLEIGPAADQFGFCVALFEGLFGRRPFVGSSFGALSIAVHAGNLELSSPRPGLPRGLIELVRRGLDPDPAARHPSMEVLLAGLGRVLHARRRRWLVAGGVAAAALALTVGFRAALAVAPHPCEQADDPATLWTDEQRESVRVGLGAGRGETVVAALDRYADAYTTKRREVCEASRVRGEQSDDTLRLRMACLDRVAGRFMGLTDEIGQGFDASSTQPEALEPEAVEARLPELAPCDDVETLAKLTNRLAVRSSRSSVAQDQAWVLAVELVERSLTRRLLGRSDAREPAQRAVELAEQHQLPGVHARALSVLADLELDAGNHSAAELLCLEAVRLAVADGHDDAVVYLVLDQADAALLDERVAEAVLHLAYFDAFVDRMTDAQVRADVVQRAEIVRARVALARGDAEQAQRRLAALPTAGLSDLDRRAAWMALGAAQRALGHDRDAHSTWTRVLALVEAMRGDRHPDVAAVLNNLALIHLDDGDSAGAETLLVRAESLTLAASQGQRTALLATIATNRGWSARLDRRFDDARHQLERALEIGRATLGPRHPSLAYALDQLGGLEREQGHYDAALERFAQAGELRDASLGVNHPETASTLVGMARVFLLRGAHERARAALDAALRIVDARPGPPRRRTEIESLLAQATRPQPLAKP